MSAAEIFGWGVMAGFFAYLAVFVAPNLRSLWRNGISRVHPARLLLMMLVFAVYLLVSGGLAVLFSQAARAHAVAAATVSWYY